MNGLTASCGRQTTTNAAAGAGWERQGLPEALAPRKGRIMAAASAGDIRVVDVPEDMRPKFELATDG